MAGPLAGRLAPVLEPPAPGAPDVLAELLSGARDRVGVPEVTQRSVWDAVPEPIRGGVLADAGAELARTAPVLAASDWARTFRDGNRGAYEGRARALRERVALLVLAAVLTGEVADAGEAAGCPHLDAAADGLVALAEAVHLVLGPARPPHRRAG